MCQCPCCYTTAPLQSRDRGRCLTNPRGAWPPGRLRKFLPPAFNSIFPFLFFLPSFLPVFISLGNWLPFMKRKKRWLGVTFQILEAGLSDHGQKIYPDYYIQRPAIGILGAQLLLQQQVLGDCFFIYLCLSRLPAVCPPHCLPSLFLAPPPRFLLPQNICTCCFCCWVE